MSLSLFRRLATQNLNTKCLKISVNGFFQHTNGLITEKSNMLASIVLPTQSSCRRFFSSPSTNKSREQVSITFLDRDGDKRVVQANVGDTLLDVAKDNDIDVEGACEGTLSCSTCHLIFPVEGYEDLPIDPPSEEELDMLDLAYGLTETSRLGCQIFVTPEMNNITLKVPTMTRDVRS